MTADYEHGFTFSVSDIRIYDFNIGGVMLAAKMGDEKAKLLFNALATFLAEVKAVWIEKWGEDELREWQARIQTIEESFFAPSPDEHGDLPGEEG